MSSSLVACPFLYFLLLSFAFSTMVDPELQPAERRREIANSFLFGDGLTQFVFVAISIFFSYAGITLCLLFTWKALFATPSMWVTLTGAIVVATLLTLGTLLSILQFT